MQLEPLNSIVCTLTFEFTSVLEVAFIEPSIRIPSATYSILEDPSADMRLTVLGALEREVARCENEIVGEISMVGPYVGLSLIAVRVYFRSVRSTTLSLKIFMKYFRYGPNLYLTICCLVKLSFEDAEADFDTAIRAHLSQSTSTVLPPTIEHLRRAEAKRNWLDDEKTRRQNIIQNLYDELYTLWAKLGVSEEDQETFLELWKGLSYVALRRYVHFRK